jgi:hypothetical protein
MQRTHAPLTVTLGPGLLGNVFDGLQVCVPVEWVPYLLYKNARLSLR